MEEKNCKHDFIAQNQKVEEVIRMYKGNYENELITLRQEDIYVFCTKCGENKIITKKRDLLDYGKE